MPSTPMDMEHRHRDALKRVYQAEQMWSDQGNQPRSFLLLHLGGMRSQIDHPGWDGSWAVPSEHTIDDLAKLQLLRVEPSDGKARTFVLTMKGRKEGALLAAPAVTPTAPRLSASAPSAAAAPVPATIGPEPEGADRQGGSAPSAFVTWAHGNDTWQKTIADFTVRLRQLGIAADVDLFELHNPNVNWATYGPGAIQENEFVILAVSQAYKERWEGTNAPSTGAGAAREANVLKGLFNEDQHAFYRKVKIVILPGAAEADIPAELNAAPQHFQIDSISDAVLEDLLRTLTGQPAFPRPAVGEVPVLPPKFMSVGSGEIGNRPLPDPEALPAGLRTRLAELEQRLNELSGSDERGRKDLTAERTTVEAALDALAAESSSSPTPEGSASQQSGSDEAAPPTLNERQMLEAIYEAFSPVGDWPRFQYVTALLWEKLQGEPREVYHQLSEHDFVYPAVTARQDFQLREDTQVAVSLLGLTYLSAAAEDIANFVSAVRYLAERAVGFRPSTPTEVEHLTVTSEEVRLKLSIAAGDPALLRLGALLREEAWSLRTTFNWQGAGPWSMVVIPEAGRRYRDIHTIIDFMALRACRPAGA
jgi:SEFIR domain